MTVPPLRARALFWLGARTGRTHPDWVRAQLAAPEYAVRCALVQAGCLLLALGAAQFAITVALDRVSTSVLGIWADVGPGAVVLVASGLVRPYARRARAVAWRCNALAGDPPTVTRPGRRELGLVAVGVLVATACSGGVAVAHERVAEQVRCGTLAAEYRAPVEALLVPAGSRLVDAHQRRYRDEQVHVVADVVQPDGSRVRGLSWRLVDGRSSEPLGYHVQVYDQDGRTAALTPGALHTPPFDAGDLRRARACR